MERTRIILADDHTLIIEALKGLLEPEFEVVGTFADGHKLIDAVPELKPDVIVLDIGMPTMNGLIAAEKLKRLMPAVKIVFLTMDRDPDTAGEAFRLGASAYLLKNSAASELIAALRVVMRGGLYVTPLITKGMDGPFIQKLKRRAPEKRLTVRQKEVLQLLAEGRSMKQAAFILNVSPRTVAYHKYTMMANLCVKSTAELIEFAVQRPAMCG